MWPRCPKARCWSRAHATRHRACAGAPRACGDGRERRLRRCAGAEGHRLPDRARPQGAQRQDRRRDAPSSQFHRVRQRPPHPLQHGAMALDARPARRLPRLGQHPRLHDPCGGERQGDPCRADRRRQARHADADLLRSDGADHFPPVLGRAGFHQAQRDAAQSCAGGAILARQGLKVQYRGRDIDPNSVDWQTADMRNFHIYQPPGPSNVLGVVKFRFPNKHDVYFHDTSQRACSVRRCACSATAACACKTLSAWRSCCSRMTETCPRTACVRSTRPARRKTTRST